MQNNKQYRRGRSGASVLAVSQDKNMGTFMKLKGGKFEIDKKKYIVVQSR